MFKVAELSSKTRTFSITRVYGVSDDEGCICGSVQQYVYASERKSFEVPAGMSFVEATKLANGLNDGSMVI